MPVASAMTAVHRDRLVVASNAQWSQIQPLMFRGQTCFRRPPMTCRGTNVIYDNNIMIRSY